MESLNINTIISLFTLFYVHYLQNCNSARCGALVTQDQCDKNPSCDWSDLADPPCFCAANAPLDIMFMIDESNSMKTEGFEAATNYTADMIRDGVSASSNIHIGKFSKKMRYAWQFWDPQGDLDMIEQAARDSPYEKQGNTRMLTAVNYTINAYEKWEAYPNYRAYNRLFIFITDGRPYPRKPKPAESPCPMVKKLHEVVGGNVVIVGLGTKWRLRDIECMITPGYDYDNVDPSAVHDPDRVIEVADWTPDQFAAANINAQAFLCPDAFDIKLTEIRLNTFNKDTGTYTSRFVEYYNDGNNALDLSFNNLRFDGFMTSEAFGVAGNPTCNVTIPREKLVVFYDPSAPDLPECPGCNCTLSGSNLWCEEAIYIPCDHNISTSGCGNCTWNTTMTSEEWWQEAYDLPTYPDSPLSSIHRDKNETGWLDMYPGYSNELKTILDLEVKQNFKMSCNYSGTPGAPPLDPCEIDCVPAICRLHGDVNATCDDPFNGYDRCKCTAANNWYLSASDGCLYLEAPIDCEVYNSIDDDLEIPVFEVYWDKKSLETRYEKGTYFLVEFGSTQIKATAYQVFDTGSIPGTTQVTVRAVFPDPVNGLVYSDAAICAINTIAPTQEPTPDPTQSNADIDECKAVIIGGSYDSISIDWSDGYAKDLTDIDPIYGYYVFGQWDPTDDTTAFQYEYSTTYAIIRNIKPSFDVDSNGYPIIYVVTKMPTAESEANIDYDRIIQPGQGRIQCTVSTSAPTTSPTSDPTADPTGDPTADPTTDPTKRPSYADYEITSCTVDIPARHRVEQNEEVTVYIDYVTPEDGHNEPKVFLKVNDVQVGSSFGKFMKVRLDQDVIEEAISGAGDGFQVFIQYALYEDKYGKLLQNSDNFVCSFETKDPTTSPTQDPTGDPTKDPTIDPTSDPTRDPTKIPTQSPTFQKLSLTECTATINSDATAVIVRFTEPFYDDNDVGQIYPQSRDISYEINIGPFRNKDDISNDPIAEESEKDRSIPIDISPNQWIIGQESGDTEVTIGIGNDYGDSIITCSIRTEAPTASPTTPSPTDYPTSDHPFVKLDLIDTEGNVKNTWGFNGDNGGCIFPSDEDVRRRLQDISASGNTPTSAPTIATLINDCPYCPICTISEDEDVKYIRIVREPSTFLYDLLIRVQLFFLEDTAGNGMNSGDFDFDAFANDRPWRSNWKELFRGKQTPYYINGGTGSANVEIPYRLKVNDDPEGEQEKAEAFRFDLESCEVDESRNAQNRMPEELTGTYACNRGLSSVIIIYEPQQLGDAFTSTSQGDLPLWIWAPVGIAGIAIPILAYLIYRFYNAKKIADAMEIQRKHELEEQEKEDDVGNFGTLGDNVQANPLATGDAFEVPKGDAVIDHQLAIDKMNFEIATPDVEHNVFKQDFGPVQAQRNTLD